MAGELQPLDLQFPIVDAQGRPTQYFIRWAQQRQIDIGDSITLTDLQAFLTAHKLVAGNGIGLAPDGDLNNSPTITAKVQEILDQISAVRGTVLYRGAAGWAGLAPGAAGQFLKTNGAGADPAWAAAGGGGAITTLGAPDTLSKIQSVSVNFYLMKSILVSSAFSINKIAFEMGAAIPTTKMQPFVYASSTTGVPGALLATGPQVTGVVAGYNEVPLAAPLAVTKGLIIYVGVNVTTAALTSLWCQPGGIAAFAANGGSTVPANPCPAVTSSNVADQIHGFWAV
jgi:hypothetical protein